MTYKLPELGFAYNALEPHIDAKTMEIHHSKHHQGYTDKLNAAVEDHSDLQKKSAEELVANLKSVPEEIREAVRNSGGGYINHNLFWEVMSPEGGGQPQGVLAKEIDNKFGSYEKFTEEFSEVAATVFGSGWAWLVVDGDDQIRIDKTANQDSLLSTGNVPILALDVWEHAYYLKYQNRRPEYIKSWWQVVNWGKVEKLYQEALAR